MERFRLDFREKTAENNAKLKVSGFEKASMPKITTHFTGKNINKDVLVQKINAVADIVNKDNVVIINKEMLDKITHIIEE